MKSIKCIQTYRLSSLTENCTEIKKSMYEPKSNLQMAVNGTVITKEIGDDPKCQL